MSHRARLSQGFSLVELMIGITVGLFILLGASSLMVSQISDHRRLMLETRTEQDVRAISELMSQDLQRAGVWQEPTVGVWSESNATPQPNPLAGITLAADGTSIEFSHWPPNAAAPVARGYRLDGDVLRSLEGATWQPLTDPDTLKVTGFKARMYVTTQGMESACAQPCDGAPNCPPRVEVREVVVDVEARAAHDDRVKRGFSVRVRLPSDRLLGACRAL